jgi:surface carbohydrate biosynthesis protein
MKLTIQKAARPLIHLPIETKSREFDSRCLIALECVRRGAIAVIGPATMLPYRIPHVVLLKSASRFELARILAEQAHGALSAVLDEEGVVHTSDRREHAMRYSQETLDAVDRVLLNGANEMGVLDEHYQLDTAKCVLTGNPRFDFYKLRLADYYARDAAELNRRFGRFILVPSRFGNVNLARSMDFIQFHATVRKLDPVTELPILEAYHAYTVELYRHFEALLPALAKRFPQHTIVLRPHPSERHDAWHRAAGALDNVKIINEGPIGPWLRAASAVVHNGCTTGVEAFLMGRPVFAYMPIESELYDLPLPNAVSTQARTLGGLLDRVAAGLESGSDCSSDERATRVDYALRHLANAGQRLAYEQVADELIVLARSHPMGVRPLRGDWRTRTKMRVRHLVRLAAAGLYRAGILLSQFAEDANYGFLKNPGVTMEELRMQLQRLAPLTGIDPQTIEVSRLDAHRFCINLTGNDGGRA